MEEVSIVRTGLDGHEADLRPLLREYFREADRKAVAHFEELSGIDLGEAVEEDVDRLADPALSEPLFLARDGDRIVGTVQLKRLDAATAEVKRLYVVPERRGEGIGRALMERVVEAADRDGVDRLRLGVGPYLEAARSLYADLGFESIPPYEGTQAPEAVREEWRFMELRLGD